MQCAPQQTGRGHALRLLRPAARQQAAVAKPLQGPVASARSCATLSSASYHHRNQPSLEPILPRATKRGCFCGMLAAATTDPRRAALVLLPLLANSVPKARSALCIRIERGQIDRAHHASPESVTLRSLSEHLTLVTAVTSILLRHGRLRRERDEPPWYSSRKPQVPRLAPTPSYNARVYFVSGATT